MPRGKSTAQTTATTPLVKTRSQRTLRSVDDADDAYVEALDQLPEKFLDCRRSHLWKVTKDFHLVDVFEEVGRYPRAGHSRFVEQIWTCTRCGMKRSDAFALETRGRLTVLRKLGGSSYDPPEGYYVVGIPGSTAGRGELLRGLQYERVMGSRK